MFFKKIEPIQDRIFVVTGAARGIGLSTARALIQRGTKVVICDVDTVQGQISADELGPSASFYQLDVSNRSMFKAVIDQIETDVGPVHGLINNAGILSVGSILEQSEAGERKMIDVNLFGTLNGIHAVLPKMQDRRSGTIVNVASLTSKIPAPFGAMYTATKFAISGLTEALRQELGESGIHLSIIYPALVNTELTSGIKPTLFPPPLSSVDVAEAIVQAIQHRKNRAYVPKIGAALGLLPSLLPDKLIVRIADLTGLTNLFDEVDVSQRSAYRNRIKPS